MKACTKPGCKKKVVVMVEGKPYCIDCGTVKQFGSK